MRPPLLYANPLGGALARRARAGHRFFTILHSCLFLLPPQQTIWSTFSPCLRIRPILCTRLMTMAPCVKPLKMPETTHCCPDKRCLAKAGGRYRPVPRLYPNTMARHHAPPPCPMRQCPHKCIPHCSRAVNGKKCWTQGGGLFRLQTPPSRPPKVFAPGWGLEFEQAASLGWTLVAASACGRTLLKGARDQAGTLTRLHQNATDPIKPTTTRVDLCHSARSSERGSAPRGGVGAWGRGGSHTTHPSTHPPPPPPPI